MNLYQSTDSKTLHDAGIWYILKKRGGWEESFSKATLSKEIKQQSCRYFKLQLKNNKSNLIQLHLPYTPWEEIKKKKEEKKLKALSVLESCFYNSSQGGLLTVLTNLSSWTLGVCFASCQHVILLHLGLSEGKRWNCGGGYRISSSQALRKALFSSVCVQVWMCVYGIKLWANIWKDSSLSNKFPEWRELYRMISKAYTWQLYIFYETVMHLVPFLNSLFYGCSISYFIRQDILNKSNGLKSIIYRPA